MLATIHIENIAIMDNVSLDFNEGFNVLTGQTGAGKSIIIDSINLLTGERSSKELVRSGENKALVEGTVYTDDAVVYELLNEAGIEYFKDEPLVFSREITKDGRSTVRINNRVSTSTLLRQICARIINIHGQHDNQAILDVKFHREFLDAYAELSDKLKEYQAIYEKYIAVKNQLETKNEDEELIKRRIEILTYDINEIEASDLKEGEDEELYNIRNRFINNEKIKEFSNEALISLSGNEEINGARELLSRASSALGNLAKFDDRVKESAEKATEYYYMIDDLTETVRDFVGDDFDEIDINLVEERIDLINRLKKKHGSTIKEITEKLVSLKEELDLLENRDTNRAKLEKECQELYYKAKMFADSITKERTNKAKELEKAVKEHLESLEMPNVGFKILIENADLSKSGADNIEFLISANKGEELKPLNKVASGGELSRIILAMKVCLAKADSVDTMVFDEVDTGVSGSTSQRIAEKLKTLAKDKQIFAITHSPQIAAFADYHYLVEKTENEEKTVSTVKLLDENERNHEIARIISGSTVTESAINTAKELIKEGNNYRA